MKKRLVLKNWVQNIICGIIVLLFMALGYDNDNLLDFYIYHTAITIVLAFNCYLLIKFGDRDER